MSDSESKKKVCNVIEVTYDEKEQNFPFVKQTLSEVYDRFKLKEEKPLMICVNLTVRNTLNPEIKETFFTRKLIIIIKLRKGKEFFESGIRHTYSEDNAVITLCENAVLTKNNFIATMAHEIGHIVFAMRIRNTPYTIYGDKNCSKESIDFSYELFEECSADTFALCVLGSMSLFKLTRWSLINYIKKYSDYKHKEDVLISLGFRSTLISDSTIESLKKEFHFTRTVKDHRLIAVK